LTYEQKAKSSSDLFDIDIIKLYY